MILLTDGQLTVPLEQASLLSATDSCYVLLDGTSFGPFPAAEAIFYATRTSHSSSPLLSMQRFEQIQKHCTFKTTAVEFITT